MSIVLERRLTKDQILELYLNDVCARSARLVRDPRRRRSGAPVLRQGRQQPHAGRGRDDRRRHPVAVAATRRSTIPTRASERRNVVLHAMAEAGVHHRRRRRARVAASRCRSSQRALESEAPYFVDYVSQEMAGADYKAVRGAVDVYTTLDLHLQRIAQDAVRDGLTRVDEILAKRKRRMPQAALIAIDPRTGEILAMVGGRVLQPVAVQPRHQRASRQPGSVFKPFVYLAAFERARRPTAGPTSRRRRSSSTSRRRSRSTTSRGRRATTRTSTTGRSRCGARSRTRATSSTIKVAESTGYDNVAALWRKCRRRHAAAAYPSIALGVFEATPFEIATAYTIFPNGGTIRPLRAIAPHRRAAARTCRSTCRRREGRRAQGHDLSRDQHDAQRAQRRHRRRRARRRLHARRRRQDRHDQRPARRVVRRLHAGAADRGLGRPRRQPGRSA